MELRTKITLPPPAFGFSYRDTVLLMGSCFAENIGAKLEEGKFPVDINPFGTLYNPASVALSLRMLLRPERLSPAGLFEHEGTFHSFAYHSRFSSHDADEALGNMNERLFASSANLRKASRLIVTFGTAFVYRLKEGGAVVSNCHKLPERLFSREMLSVDEIAGEWETLLLALWEQAPDLKTLFTVSPIRHWKDGAHGNQLSKATLLLAVDRLQKRFPERIDYFPSYEIMMDELRDYRFYADDMLHPSPLAVDYIWETFAAHRLPAETKEILGEWQEIRKAIHHKPFHPASDAYRRFISQTLLKAEHLSEKFPFFDLSKEIKVLQAKIEL